MLTPNEELIIRLLAEDMSGTWIRTIPRKVFNILKKKYPNANISREETISLTPGEVVLTPNRVLKMFGWRKNKIHAAKWLIRSLMAKRILTPIEGKSIIGVHKVTVYWIKSEIFNRLSKALLHKVHIESQHPVQDKHKAGEMNTKDIHSLTIDSKEELVSSDIGSCEPSIVNRSNYWEYVDSDNIIYRQIARSIEDDINIENWRNNHPISKKEECYA